METTRVDGATQTVGESETVNDSKLQNSFKEWIGNTLVFTFAPIIITFIIGLSSASELNKEAFLNIIGNILRSGSVVISSFSLVVSSIFSLFKRENAEKNFLSFSFVLLAAIFIAAAYGGIIMNPKCTLIHSGVVSFICFISALVISFRIEKSN